MQLPVMPQHVYFVQQRNKYELKVSPCKVPQCIWVSFVIPKAFPMKFCFCGPYISVEVSGGFSGCEQWTKHEEMMFFKVFLSTFFLKDIWKNSSDI